MQVTVTAKYNWIPFIGGKLEDLILSNITLLFDAEEAFTADWIARNHRSTHWGTRFSSTRIV